MARHHCPARYLRPGQLDDEAAWRKHIDKVIARRDNTTPPPAIDGQQDLFGAA